MIYLANSVFVFQYHVKMYTVIIKDFKILVQLIHLMGLFHWNRSYHQLYDSRVSCKSQGAGQKSRKKGGKNLGQFYFTDRTQYIPTCLDLEADLTWDRDVFYTTRHETTRTSCKP